MAAVTIRKALHEDVPVIAKILRELGWFPYIDKESETATELRIRLHLELADADDSHTVLVAEDEEIGVAGYISVHWLPYLLLSGPEGFVSEIFVREEARGKGVGTALMNDVRELAVAKRCSRLSLLSNRERGPREKDFYLRFGFEERPEMANMVLQFAP